MATVEPNDNPRTLQMPLAGARVEGTAPPTRRQTLAKAREGPTTARKPSAGDAPSAPLRRQSTVLIRKRLPWLDGNQQSRPSRVPGEFDEDAATAGDACELSLTVPDRQPPLVPNLPSAFAISKDPALRASGSTPSLRARAKLGQLETLSLSSKVRTGIMAPGSKEEAKDVLGVVEEGAKRGDYVSSEYSTTLSSDREAMGSPEQKASQPGPSVVRMATAKFQAQDPFSADRRWLQNELNLPSDEPPPRTSHRGFTNRRHTESCRSCDQSPPLQQLPKARTMTRGSMAIPPGQPDQVTPIFAAPTRKPTLFAMPSHLMASSSSSSWEPASAKREIDSSPPPPAPPPPRRPTNVATLAPADERQSQSLNRAVNGLENLMEEALNVARDAAQAGRNEEVANVLNSATLALRKASTTSARMDEGRMKRPLRLSPPESPHHHSDSDSIAPDSDASSTHSTHHSVETAPTLFTQPSQQPVLKDHYRANDRSPWSQRASFEDAREGERGISPGRHSRTNTPPRLYQPPSADSIVRDFAYAKQKNAKAEAARALSRAHGAAEDYYGNGDYVDTQPGVRPSVSKPIITDKPLPPLPPAFLPPRTPTGAQGMDPPHGPRQHRPVRRVEPAPTQSVPARVSSRPVEQPNEGAGAVHRRKPRRHHPHHISDLFESSYYHARPQRARSVSPPRLEKQDSLKTDSRYEAPPLQRTDAFSKPATRYSGPPTLLKRDISLRHPRRKHISLREGQGFSLGRYHRRKPIAREWNTHRKRITATIACLNTVFVGLIAGIYVSGTGFVAI